MGLDKIKIEDLEVFANHGVFPEERTLGQKFFVTVELYTDTRKAGRTDSLSCSIDYGEISRRVEEFVRTHTFQLLERVAEMLAEDLLLHVTGLREVGIEIKKPWAPVGLPLKTVSVAIHRSWHKAYLSLGSNIGDRKAYLEDAVKKLSALERCRMGRVSSFFETPPYGVTDQDDFLNACLELETLLEPVELLEEMHRLEKEAKRERTRHWGPRTLDLDLIFYDNLICQEEDLCIPHVEMHKRKFVLEPLCQIAPYKRHPANGKTVKEMLEELDS